MELRILETIPAKDGWRCAFATAAGELELRPVSGWAVVEGIPGARGPEVCPLVRYVPPEATGGGKPLPQVRPLIEGLTAYRPQGYLGLLDPEDDDEPYRDLASRRAGGPGPRPPGAR